MKSIPAVACNDVVEAVRSVWIHFIIILFNLIQLHVHVVHLLNAIRNQRVQVLSNRSINKKRRSERSEKKCTHFFYCSLCSSHRVERKANVTTTGKEQKQTHWVKRKSEHIKRQTNKKSNEKQKTNQHTFHHLVGMPVNGMWCVRKKIALVRIQNVRILCAYATAHL